MSSGRGVYFPNLDGLRFIAALAVVIHHTEQFKYILGLPSVWASPGLAGKSILILGKLGVVLFFVLSGFLITYLLLEEERGPGIGVRQFYVRRILRIWPLYYLIVGLALFVLPYVSFFRLPQFGIDVVHEQLPLKLALYGTFFANVVLANVGFVPYASQAWSIGTEEQFYLLWPLLMKHVRHKIRLMATVIILYLLATLALSLAVSGSGPAATALAAFLGMFNIDCMAIGGLAAVILHRKLKPLGWLLDRRLFYAVLAGTALLIACGVQIPFAHHEVYAVLFAFLILNFAANDSLGFSLEARPLRYLGRVSYGIYMFHPIAIVAVLRVLGERGWARHSIVLQALCVLATVALSALSYRYFESPFLRLKGRFTRVLSGRVPSADLPHEALTSIAEGPLPSSSRSSPH